MRALEEATDGILLLGEFKCHPPYSMGRASQQKILDSVQAGAFVV